VPQGAEPRGGRHPEIFDRTGYELTFDENFVAPALNPARWVPHYLPHWTTPERSAARFSLRRGLLRLRIDADQPAWRLEDGEMRVSNIQTGTFSGPVGSQVGQHRHRPGLEVRTPQSSRRLYTPSSGLAEATLRASADPTCMLAFWLVGFEETSGAQSGEICVAELYGSAIGPRRSNVRMGVKAHHDPHLQDDVADVALDLDGTAWHSYAADWTAEQVRFFRRRPTGQDRPSANRLSTAADGRSLRVPPGQRPRSHRVPQVGRGQGRPRVPACRPLLSIRTAA
jgi:hypothetical protein